jgi:hypothetical protein
MFPPTLVPNSLMVTFVTLTSNCKNASPRLLARGARLVGRRGLVRGASRVYVFFRRQQVLPIAGVNDALHQRKVRLSHNRSSTCRQTPTSSCEAFHTTGPPAGKRFGAPTVAAEK